MHAVLTMRTGHAANGPSAHATSIEIRPGEPVGATKPAPNGSAGMWSCQ